MSLAAYATRAPLRRAPVEPLSACSHTPFRHAKALVRGGVSGLSSVPETGRSIGRSRALRRPYHGPFATVHLSRSRPHDAIDVTTPGPQHSAARSTSWRSAYRSWVAQPGPSTTIVHTPSRTERTDACGANGSPDDLRPRARRASRARRARGMPSSRPTAAIASRSEHRLVARAVIGSRVLTATRRGRRGCAAPGRARRRPGSRPRSSAASGPAAGCARARSSGGRRAR